MLASTVEKKQKAMEASATASHRTLLAAKRLVARARRVQRAVPTKPPPLPPPGAQPPQAEGGAAAAPASVGAAPEKPEAESGAAAAPAGAQEPPAPSADGTPEQPPLPLQERSRPLALPHHLLPQVRLPLLALQRRSRSGRLVTCSNALPSS